MVLLAMCQLGIGLDDARFVKGENSVLDAMLRFRNADGSFSHEAGKGANTLRPCRPRWRWPPYCAAPTG